MNENIAQQREGKIEKILKYLVWAGLLAVCFIPLFYSSKFYFPYVFPKSLAFRIIIEVIFLAFLGLAVMKKEYRPRLNLALALFFLYIAAVFVSSLLGNSFYFSFWSNSERSEGLLLLLHLLAYLVILAGFLRSFKKWLVIFEASFLSSILVSLFALGQYLNLSWILKSGGGQRLASTTGNAAYTAGYLIFNIFFGLILFFSRKNKILRWYYVLGIILQIFIVLNTFTRGAILALGLSFFVFLLYLAFSKLKQKKLFRNSIIAVLILGIIFTVFIFLQKEADWVAKNPILERIASISTEAITAQTRLMTWQSAWQGFKQKPLLGYGYENFYQVFDKYFNPKIYRKAGSTIWYDRAHNIVFDRLISGGLVGLLLYLGFLFLPVYYAWRAWRYFRKKKIASPGDKTGLLEGEKGSLILVIFTLVMAAYFIQNLFIFEALVTYIPLFLVLAFLSQFCLACAGPAAAGAGRQTFGEKFSQSKKPYLILLVVGIILFLPFLFSANIKPASANLGLVKAAGMIEEKKYQEAFDKMIEVIDKNTIGNQEYRQHLAELVVYLIESSALGQEWQSQAVLKMEKEFDKQLAERPQSSRNYLMVMRFLNKTYVFDPNRLSKALDLSYKVIELSPTRPQVYEERGFSQLYIGKQYKANAQNELAEQLFDQAIASMKKSVELNDQVVESYINLIMILFSAGRGTQVQGWIDKMDQGKIDYHYEDSIARMANSAVHAGAYDWTLIFYKELTELAPQDPSYFISLALSYAYLGRNAEAIKTAESIKSFGPEFVQQADAFIADVRAGKYIR